MKDDIEDADVSCIEELFGYIMDKEQRREKEIDHLIETYKRIEDINYCMFLAKRFAIHRYGNKRRTLYGTYDY